MKRTKKVECSMLGTLVTMIQNKNYGSIGYSEMIIGLAAAVKRLDVTFRFDTKQIDGNNSVLVMYVPKRYNNILREYNCESNELSVCINGYNAQTLVTVMLKCAGAICGIIE